MYVVEECVYRKFSFNAKKEKKKKKKKKKKAGSLCVVVSKLEAAC